MPIFTKWAEIYVGSDTEEYFGIQNLLRDNGVRFRSKTESPRGRMSTDVITGGSPAALNGVGLKDQYTILVREADEHRARELLAARPGKHA